MRRELSAGLLRLVLAWAVLCALAYVAGVPLIRAMSPAFKVLVETARPDLRVKSITVAREGVTMGLEKVYQRQGLHVQTPSSFGFTAPIVVLTLLAAWPFASWRRRLVAAAVASALLLGLMLVDVPTILVLSLEEDASRREPFMSFLYFNGGRQFLAVLVFGASLAASSRSAPVTRRAAPRQGRGVEAVLSRPLR